MSNQARLNYIIDLMIGFTFIFSALSGLILLVVPSGYHGGRNPFYQEPVLFLPRQDWNTIHTWSSISMISGIGAHMVMHWTWIVCMTRKLLGWKAQSHRQTESCPIE